MTTIAWDGKYLAADQGAWKQGHIDAVPTKIYRINIDGRVALFGHMGVASFGRRLLAHLSADMPLPDWRDYGMESGACTCGILIFQNGVIQEVDALGNRIAMLGHGTRGVIAAGGGREMALGALMAGASAERAVEIAIEFSDYGGHGVTVLTHEGD